MNVKWITVIRDDGWIDTAVDGEEHLRVLAPPTEFGRIGNDVYYRSYRVRISWPHYEDALKRYMEKGNE